MILNIHVYMCIYVDIHIYIFCWCLWDGSSSWGKKPLLAGRCFCTRGKHGVICGHTNASLKPDHLWISCFPSGLIHHVIDFQRASVGKYPHQSVPEMRESFEYRCMVLSGPHHWKHTWSQETIAGWLCCIWQKLQLFCSQCRYLHLNAYCRNLNSIKTDCKSQLLGCVWEWKKGGGKEKEFQ